MKIFRDVSLSESEIQEIADALACLGLAMQHMTNSGKMETAMFISKLSSELAQMANDGRADPQTDGELSDE